MGSLPPSTAPNTFLAAERASSGVIRPCSPSFIRRERPCLISSTTLHTLSGGNLQDSDGFTILPNGNYLINEGDATNLYDQYDPTTGNEISGTNIVDAPGTCSESTGVDTNGANLFFSCNFNSIEETDFAGNAIKNFSDPGGAWEDISLNQEAPIISPHSVPEPITLTLFGVGLAGAFGMRRKRKA